MVARRLLLVVLLTLAGRELGAQSIQLNSVQLSNQLVRFQVQGPSNTYLRVDSSPDLLNWLPVDLYFNTNAANVHLTTDAFNPATSAQFYRAEQADPSLEVLGFSPSTGGPGTRLQIIGQFYPPTEPFVVSIGGVTAQVLSGTSTKLTVTVPAGAVSGRITASAPNGTATSSGVYVALSNAIVSFQPPAGLTASNYVVEDFYGSGVLLSNTATTEIYSIPVRLGSPTMIFADAPGLASNLFFCAISFGAGQPIILNATSTAQALVFQNDNLFTSDASLGPEVMGIIQTNAAVQTFAQVLASDMAVSATPYEDAVVTNAFQNAVISVVNGEGFSALAAALAPASTPARPALHPRVASPFSAEIYEIEYLPTRFLQLSQTGSNYKGLNFKMGVSDIKIFNPVDWLVAYQDVDVDLAFPNGTLDFNPIWQDYEKTPQVYPTKGLFYTERDVGADLASSRINVVGTLTKALFKVLLPNQVDTSVAIPQGNAMYLVRGVGPSLVTPEDFSFVNNHMASLYVRAVAINLAAAAMELASLVMDDSAKDAVGTYTKYQNLAVMILKSAGSITSEDEFKRVAYTLSATIVQDLIKSAYKNGLTEVLQIEAGNLAGINAKLKVVSAVGQLAERASGLFRTTALETSFIVVGDPFSLQVSVNPSVASPGQIVTVQIKGSPALKAFDPNDASHNTVTFEGKSYFPGQVTAVSGPDASGVQTLSLLIPGSLGSTSDGLDLMIVRTQGRTGTANFTVSTAAALQTVTPLSGFAPAANFQGSAFAGSSVRLQGAVFTASDTFLFAGGASGVAATSVQANASTGDVTIKVPSGAVTGPIQILHKITNGGTLTIPGPVFTVLGPPVITSVQPGSGAPVGSLLNLTVPQAGTVPSLIYAQFSGSRYANNVVLMPDGALIVLIPTGTQTGSDFLTVFTPAGSNQVPYNVFPAIVVTNPPAGAVVTVGGTSIITMTRALQFVNGVSLPNQDEYVSGIGTIETYTNTPKPWGLGLAFADSITGTSSEDATISRNFLGFGGNFSGNIVVSGDNNQIGGTMQGAVSVLGGNNALNGTYNGPVTISGNANKLNATYNGPVTITGTNTSVGGLVHAPMTVAGDNTSFFDLLTTFQGVAGNALTILGNRNTGTINCFSNTGDGLVINGGKYNQFTVNQSLGNGGNGVTLTGGAQENQLIVGTGIANYTTDFGTAGTGNKGHGVALIGSATANVITGLLPGLSGNGLDGLYMDGPGVTLNNIISEATYNGRNGMTLTHGASMNNIGTLAQPFYYAYGSSAIVCDYNSGSGVVCAGCGANQINIQAQSNGLYGFLASNVKAPPASFQIAVSTGATGGPGNPLHISGNGKAGVRLEKGTTGLNIYSSLANDHDGLEVDGPDVTNNIIFSTIFGAVGNGAFIANGANANTFTLGVSSCSGDGILLQGASNNLIQVFSSFSNEVNGIHVTGGSSDNEFNPAFVSGYYGASVGNNVESNRVNGFLVDGGSHDNLLDSIGCHLNGQDGIVFSGQGVTGNQVVNSLILANGRDGIRFEQGASTNAIGAESDDINGAADTTINLSGEAGVLITDAGTQGNIVRHCNIGGVSGVNAVSGAGQPFGVLAENQGGVGQITLSTIALNTNGIVLQSGAGHGILNALVLSQNTDTAILISNAFNIMIGGVGTNNHNEISASGTGIEITGPMATNNQIINNHITKTTDAVFIHDGPRQNGLAQDNVLEMNVRGVRITAATNNLILHSTIRNNNYAGVMLEAASESNLVSGNTLFNNIVGVLVSDPGTVGNTITGNSISGDSVLGIDLIQGGNNMIPPPTLLSYAAMTVKGTSQAPNGSIVEIFSDPGGEGSNYLGAGYVVNGQFSVGLNSDPTAGGLAFNLNGTVTDPAGNTSPFTTLSQAQFPIGANLVYGSANFTMDIPKSIYGRMPVFPLT